MEVPVKLSGEEAHVTVLLSSAFSTIYKPFHCVACGNIVFSYNEDEIRSIVPSGYPQLNRPGKIYRCSGVMKLRGTARIYDVLYQVMELATVTPDLASLRLGLADIARVSDFETNARCKMMYFVS